MNPIRTFPLRRPFLLSLFSAATLMIAVPAQAHVHWSVNVGIGGFAYYPAPRVYVAPRAYYPAPAVVYRAAPVYVEPEYVQPEVIYQQPVVIYDRPVRPIHAPHYYEAAPLPPGSYGYQRGYREYRDYRR